MPRDVATRRLFGITVHGEERVVIYASAPGATQAEADSAAVSRITALAAEEALSPEAVSDMMAALVIIPETRAAARYPRAMRAYYTLEEAVNQAVLETLELPESARLTAHGFTSGLEDSALVVDADPPQGE